MNISSLMNPHVATTGPDEPFERLLRAMRKTPSRLLHVVDQEGRLLGVLSSYDILKVMLPFYLDSNLAKALTVDEEFARRMLAENSHLTAQDIMATDAATLAENAHFLEAEALFKERAVTVLTVLDATGRPVGEVTRKAVLSKLVELCGPPAGTDTPEPAPCSG